MAGNLFPPAEKPPSVLGYHRILSPTAGVRVSPLCLGGANFGDAWKHQLGECTKETAFGIMDFFYENGGNFIDTASNYQAEESEMWIGEWLQKRKVRDEMVVATKYTTGWRTKYATEKIKSNLQGNHSKNLKLSVEASLRKLQTDYIDLLFVHWWDMTTSVPEVMNSLHNLVASGKVLYLGVSDTPAWIVVKCNDYARQHGLTQFSVYQGHFSAAFRDMEREILPMVQAEGMGLAIWGSLGAGQFRSKEEYEREDREGRKVRPTQSDKHRKVGEKLAEIAQRKGTVTTSVALAYARSKAPYIFPIVGGRKIDHLKGNIEALKIKLTDAEIAEIERVEPFDIGFPMSFLYGAEYHSRATTADMWLARTMAHLEIQEPLRPIEPGQAEARLNAKGHGKTGVENVD